MLVAYNIPFRDCAQFSAGGATSAAEYEAWIDGFAAGIGDYPAIVILEPDGLGIIPWYTTVDGVAEWCQPAEADPATAAAERFEMLNYAVDQLAGLPNTSVYLDGTHSGWLNVGDITRLEPNIHAGVKYIRFMMDEYFKDEPIDDLNKALMTFAAYNAGPGRLRQLRREAASRGLNPNLWFGHVERIASERIGRETVQYVSNIYKYYVAYRLLRERADERARLKGGRG